MFTLRGLPTFGPPCLGMDPHDVLGLGGLDALSPAAAAARDGVRAQPSAGVYSDQFASTNNIIATPMTWDQVNSTWKKFNKAYYDRELAAVKAITPTLNSTCPPSSMHEYKAGGWKTPACYNHGASTTAGLIPGGFALWAVGFNIGEIPVTKSPHFERTYTPNDTQRMLIEPLVIKRSMQLAHERASRSGIRVNSPTGSQHIPRDKMTVQEVLADSPRFVLGVNNMAIRAISPTTDEFTKRGGYAKWLKRGGFLISLDLIQGRIALMEESLCPRVCVSILCKCGSNALPACIGGGIPTTNDPKDGGGCFHPYIAIYQGPPWYFVLTMKHDDPGWLARAVGPLEGVINTIIKAYCEMFADSGQKKIAEGAAETCTTKDNKPCTKGSAGCNCVPPSAEAKTGANIAAFAYGGACAKALDHLNKQNPAAPVPPMPDPPLVIPESSLMPFVPWVVGGLIAGAVAFMRK
jgi:hypothetical protein